MHVLVTGCCSSIGHSICKKFKGEGWYVIGTDIVDNYDHDSINCFYKIDLKDEGQIKDLIIKIDSLDCLVNNAAYSIIKPFYELSKDDFNTTFNVNVIAPFILSRECYPLLKKSKGNIVNICSIHSINTSIYFSAYACSKSALVGLTKSLAIELAKDGIRINAVSPGCTDTQRLRNDIIKYYPDRTDIDKIISEMGEKYPLGRIGKSFEIAEAVFFLADNNKSGNTTGVNFVVDGGSNIILSTD